MSLTHVRRLLAEKSLRHFMRQGWSSIEPAQFVSGWHLDAIADHLQAVAERKIARLIINIPPRHMKSLGTGVFFPPFVWAQDPDPEETGHGMAVRPGTWMGPGVRFLFTSYNQGLSERDNVKARRLMDSAWFRGNWGDRVNFASDQNTKRRYENTRGGARFASSTTGGVLGDGGDIIVVDDPHNVMEVESEGQRDQVIQWWTEVLPTRLNDPKTGALIVIMQRLHEKDLTGHILAREIGWDHLCLPARYEPDHPHPVRSSIGFTDPRTKAGELLWPDRFDEKSLSELSIKLGSYGNAGQLQQRPAPREGGFFSKRWFEVVDAAPTGGRTVRRWDLAATADVSSDPDWTVGLKMQAAPDGSFYIHGLERARLTPAGVEALIRNTASQDGKGVEIVVPQDPGQAGKAQAAYLVGKLAGYRAKSVLETGSKATRAGPFAAQCEAGNVKLVRGPWIDTFLEELTGFPTAAHDDQVDAASGAFDALTNPPRLGMRSATSNLY
jgi:predicted phage terminase large subunit-like protein